MNTENLGRNCRKSLTIRRISIEKRRKWIQRAKVQWNWNRGILFFKVDLDPTKKKKMKKYVLESNRFKTWQYKSSEKNKFLCRVIYWWGWCFWHRWFK